MTKKDDLPAMMFYVGDWLKAPDIQCLNYELKGIWFEMLCYMWESSERGYLNYSIEELARLLRLPEDLLKQKLEQLSKRGVYSVRESDGAIYSRRMVKDQEIREIRKKAGSLGGKQTFAKKFAQAKSQANSEDENENEDVIEIEPVNEPIIEIDDSDFDYFWDSYDKKVGKPNTKKQWAKLTNAEKEKIFQMLPEYINSKPDKQYRKDPERFLKHKVFNDEIIKVKNGTDSENGGASPHELANIVARHHEQSRN